MLRNAGIWHELVSQEQCLVVLGRLSFSFTHLVTFTLILRQSESRMGGKESEFQISQHVVGLKYQFDVGTLILAQIRSLAACLDFFLMLFIVRENKTNTKAALSPCGHNMSVALNWG